MSGNALIPLLFLCAVNGDPTDPRRWSQEILPLIETYCLDCHNHSRNEGRLDLEEFGTLDEALAVRRPWRIGGRRVAQHEMPPVGAPQPTLEERRLLSEWMRESAEHLAPDQPFDPGPPLIRRLTRNEYFHTVRDVTGLWFFNAADFVNFPDNEVASGFDNNASALSLSPALFEKFFLAADRVVELWRMGLQAKPDPAAGLHGWQHDQCREAVGRLLVARPDDKTSPQTAARLVLQKFVRSAYRRPPTENETARLLAIFDAEFASTGEYTGSVLLACRPALVSPHFVLRIETEPAAVGPVDDHALAVRLSYFLWGGPPDDELAALADEGKLQESNVYRQQIDRLLKHSRGASLGERFGAQWLQLPRFDRARPSTEFFPTFNWQLRGSMRQEVERFLDHLRRENAPVTELLDARYTFVNSHLARHYGLPEVMGDELVKVQFPDDSPRGGLLGMAAVHAMNAHTHRTSPTLRGKYVLEVLLGAAPPPPPANVSQLQEDDPNKPAAKSFRELLAQHAADRSCAGCHRQIDPLGFALEEFDAIGGWRTGGPAGAIDARGVLPNGQAIDGVRPLREAIVARRDEFLRHFAEELLGYALGRPIEDCDEETLQEVLRTAAAEQNGFQAFVRSVCESRSFRWRRPATPGAAQARR